MEFSHPSTSPLTLPSRKKLVIKPGGPVTLLPFFRELWEYRDLLYILIVRDIKVRYKETVVGILWIVLQPLLTLFLFTILLGRIPQFSHPHLPYPLFLYSGLVLWQLFSRGVSEGSTSLVVNERIITKVYFPRILIPTAVVLGSLPDLLIHLLILLSIGIYYQIPFSPSVLLIPFYILFTFLLVWGISYIFSALDVLYRDVRYTLPFLIQIVFFATPIVYPSSLVTSPSGKWVLFLNPLAGLIDGFRSSLISFHSEGIPWYSFFFSVGIFFAGILFFRSMERTIADRI
jgi:lipopolysaccharide transport system permease protein